MNTNLDLIAKPGDFLLIQQQLDNIVVERENISARLKKSEEFLADLEDTYESKKSGIFSIFSKKETIERLAKEVEVAKQNVTAIKEELTTVKLNVNSLYKINDDQYDSLINVFTKMAESQKIWCVNTVRKSGLINVVERFETSFTTENIDAINSKFLSLLFKNSNGLDLYVYPSFYIWYKEGKIVIEDIKNLGVSFSSTSFQEKEGVPDDTRIIRTSWAKENKDGTPDLRYSDNREIPLVEYGKLEFFTPNFDSIYNISNYKSATEFAEKFILTFDLGNKKFAVGQSEEEFTPLYCYQLKELSADVRKHFESLSEDEDFIDQVNLVPPMNGPGFIEFCLIYDLGLVLKTIVSTSPRKKGLETVGYLLLTGYVRTKLTDWFSLEYEGLLQGYKGNAYSKLLTGLYNITQNQRFITIPGDNNPFALVPVLRAYNHPMADSYAHLLYNFANIIIKADNTVTALEEEKLKMVYGMLHDQPVAAGESGSVTTSGNAKPESKAKKAPTADTIESILKEVDELIGLDEVKNQIHTLVNFIKVQKARESSGLTATNLSYHMVFTGNPGTGKTTVARMIARIYKALGVLAEGQLVETDRSGLVAEYVGQTAVKVNKIVDSALNGILFIDEAYALAGEGNDFGKEAVATLIKRMEDERDKLIVILAGYTDEMGRFINTNPGFQSRINRYIEFKDYTPEELLAIYQSMCKKAEYSIADDAVAKLKELFEAAYANKNKSFGNARFARNVYEKTLEVQANRIASLTNLTKEILVTITANDIPVLKQGQ